MKSSMATANASSTKTREDWVNDIFKRFHGRFGNLFTNKFMIGELVNGEDIGIANAKEVWLEELADAHITVKQIERAIKAKYSYAPSCDDFIKAAKAVDYDALFAEASKGHRARRDNEAFTWTNSISYWAGAEFGAFDLLQASYDKVKARWQSCVEKAQREGFKPVPDVMLQLPEPEFKNGSPLAKKVAGTVLKDMAVGNGREYWPKLINSEGFEKLPLITKQMAADGLRSLGVTVPEHAVKYLKKDVA